jgi:hypothetical protein
MIKKFTAVTVKEITATSMTEALRNVQEGALACIVEQEPNGVGSVEEIRGLVSDAIFPGEE